MIVAAQYQDHLSAANAAVAARWIAEGIMASGHCEPRKQAEHMAAPTNLQRDDSSCQSGAVHTWPKDGVIGRRLVES
jgi:hypothetical protein